MTSSSLVTPDLDRRLLHHKDYAIEMIKSIIKDKDVDPYAGETTEELGASGLLILPGAEREAGGGGSLEEERAGGEGNSRERVDGPPWIVKSLYPHLDLSKVIMDDVLPPTPAGDTVQEETDDSAESSPKDNSVVLAQLATNASVTPLVPSTEPVDVENPIAQDIQEKDNEIPQSVPAS
ncbi:hypothetical protein SO802_019069 [Lithocarpus litseifolius]|uniref:Uncharacterized protein n=1 Tax=Lithocarpus litseifolius TaxID=425828 RepID=A0AAW2CMM3_9ROSI